MKKYDKPSPNQATAPWRQQFDLLKRAADTWWLQRTSQERRLLCLCAVVVVTALAWTLGLRPALNTIEQSRELLPRLRAQTAQVDTLILEARSLQRSQSGKIDPANLPQALRASLRRAGLEETATLSQTGQPSNNSPRQWEITMHNANATRLMEWLAGLPYLLQVQTQVVELKRASIDGRDRPGHVSGRVIVQLPEQGVR
jgi:general secretion pathway protein M